MQMLCAEGSVENANTHTATSVHAQMPMRLAVYRYPNPTFADCDAIHTAAHGNWWRYVTAHLGDPLNRAVPGVRHPNVAFADGDRARAAADRLPIDDSAGVRIDLDRPSDLSPRTGRTDPDRRTVL